MSQWFAVLSLCFSLVQFEAPSLKARLPDTVQGQLVAAYLDAFNASGEERMRTFWGQYGTKDQSAQVTAETRLERFRMMRQRLGKLEMLKLVESSESAITVQVKSSEGSLAEFTFELASTVPPTLRGIGVEELEPGQEGKPPADPKANNREWVEAVEGYLNQTVSRDQFSGAVLLARGDQVVFEKAYGFADTAAKISNRIDTKFNLGSINKIFTNIAIHQLVRQGKLSLEDRIGKFLPGYPNKDAAAKVTIRHLLAMTSGIGDFFGERYEQAPKERLKAIAAYLPLFADLPLEFEPGSRSRYSNGGYIVLGAIIEQASNTDYYAYVKKNIYEPAGMKESGWFEKDKLPANTALGYTYQDRPVVKSGDGRNPNYSTLPGKGSSAGGGYSTVRDLLAFAKAMKAGVLSSPDFNADRLGIAGGAPGISAVLDSGQDYVVIVLSNYDPPAAEGAARQIRAWIPR
jgi:CubicO group peptidase (beta-lactamase class C family)